MMMTVLEKSTTVQHGKYPQVHPSVGGRFRVAICQITTLASLFFIKAFHYSENKTSLSIAVNVTGGC